MDYRQADAIWDGIVANFTKLEDVKELTDMEELLYEVYEETLKVGRIEFEDMYNLRDDLNHAIKLRNL